VAGNRGKFMVDKMKIAMEKSLVIRVQLYRIYLIEKFQILIELVYGKRKEKIFKIQKFIDI
jgi:hypothetical protein